MQQHAPLQSVSMDILLLDTCSSAIVLQHHQQQLQSYHSDVIHPASLLYIQAYLVEHYCCAAQQGLKTTWVVVQEAAVGIGYGAAALELWEEFVIRFFRYETQLGAVVPKQNIANHLQQLAHLYESSSPVLSNIYALLSCLSPDQLPGEQHRSLPLLCSMMSLYSAYLA